MDDLVIEFHYSDGDVGAHPEKSEEARALWAQFARADGEHQAEFIRVASRR
jgi:hypothetical protein